MEYKNKGGRSETVYRCSMCREAVEDRSSTYVLCSFDMIREAPSIYLVKTCCLERFEQEHGHAWTLFSLASPNAARLLPYAVASPPAVDEVPEGILRQR